MRLPTGPLSEISHIFIGNRPVVLLGCVSFERRSLAVPLLFSTHYGVWKMHLVSVRDPEGAYPDFAATNMSLTLEHRAVLDRLHTTYSCREAALLEPYDGLLDVVEGFEHDAGTGITQTTVLMMDITSLPKRFFAFFVKRFIKSDIWPNIVVTYTLSGRGYTRQPLATDPLPGDHLPGFGPPRKSGAHVAAVSVGYETLNIRALLEEYHADLPGARNVRFLMSFPPDGGSFGRQLRTLYEIAGGHSWAIDTENLEVVSAWDTELAYRTLDRWSKGGQQLVLAPFGSKPHALGMVLFALKNSMGLFYTQPRSYNPHYSTGVGGTVAYVVKWDGIPCYDRPEASL